TSHSDNESYSARDLMTPDEVKNLPDDTQIIVFANKPPIKAKKALQFNIFPEPEKLLSQLEYHKQTNPKQLEAYNLESEEYEKSSEKKEIRKKERQNELEEMKDLAKQENKEEALNSYLDDFNDEDSLDEVVDE